MRTDRSLGEPHDGAVATDHDQIARVKVVSSQRARLPDVAENAQRAGLHLRLDEAGRTWLLDAEKDGRDTQDYTAIIATIDERARATPTAGTEQA